MALTDLVQELTATRFEDQDRATEGEQLALAWSELTDEAEIILRQVVADAYCVAQEWDQRLDCLIRSPDGEPIGEMIGLGELTAERLGQTGERLRRWVAGDEIKLVNPVWTIRIVSVG